MKYGFTSRNVFVTSAIAPTGRLRRMVQRFARRQEVARAEAEEVRPVERKQREAARQGVEFVEVEREVEKSIGEAVALRRKALVQDGALVERRSGDGRVHGLFAGVPAACHGSRPSSSVARFTAESRPSS